MKIITNPHLVGNPQISGVIQVNYSQNSSKYTIRNKDGEYLGFVTPDSNYSGMFFIHIKGLDKSLQLKRQKYLERAIYVAANALIKHHGRVWSYTKTNHTDTWEIYYV